VPSALRCDKLGKALRRAIESFPEDLSAVLVATGGLSHQVHGERAGFNNTAWDMQFLELFEKDPVRLTELTQAQYARLGGFEGAEVIMWLVVRGALSATVRKIHQTYYLPSMTSIATAIYENEAIATEVDTAAAHRAKIGRELAGAEALDCPGSTRKRKRLSAWDKAPNARAQTTCSSGTARPPRRAHA
jgi:gallate dioxygenase